jgi:hypothetical protein
VKLKKFMPPTLMENLAEWPLREGGFSSCVIKQADEPLAPIPAHAVQLCHSDTV